MAVCNHCNKGGLKATLVNKQWRYFCPRCQVALEPAPQRPPIVPRRQPWER